MHRHSLFVRLFAGLLLLAAVRASAAETAWPVPDWQTASPDSQQMSSDGLTKVRDWLEQHGSKTGLVVRHGQIVGEWYFGDATAKSKYIVYSTTKSFASTAAAMAIYDGKLTLDTKVGSVLAEAAPSPKGDVTLRQVISMTTGVHNDTKIHMDPERFTHALTTEPMDFPPGTKWDYNNTGLSLLSPLIRKATGRDIDQWLAERVFAPIGIQAEDWSWERAEDYPLPYSGLHINARALARFGLLFLNDGKWQDRQVVPAEWVKEATGPSQDLNKSYGYLWWNNTTGKWKGVPADAYAALGRFDNDMLIVPSLDLIVIRQIGDDPEPKRKLQIGELFALAVEAAK